MELKNKVVVITGGTKGLGKALALSLKDEGALVSVCARNEEGFSNLPEDILTFKADVTKEEDLTKVLENTIEKFGKVDIWVNNAGIWMPHALVEDFDMEKVRRMFEVNVFGVMNGSRVAIRYMKEKKEGSILNIISSSALGSRPMSSAYSSSKWAIRGFTQSIREANKDLHVIGVYPSAMKTEIFGDNKPDNFETLLTPDFVAEKIVENLKKENMAEDFMIQG